MGRHPIDIDPDMVLDLLGKGYTQKNISTELGVSVPTLSKRMADLREKQGLLTQYRAIQSLHLTELQCRVLEAITPEKINEAPLRDLVLAFKVLKDKELTLEGKPSEIKGLLGYLIQLEKEDAALARPTAGQVIDINGVCEEAAREFDSDEDEEECLSLDDDESYIPKFT